MITDSHCHLFWNSFQQDLAQTLQRAKDRGVERMVVVGTNVETSKQAKQLADQHENLYATAGIHPHDTEQTGEAERAAIRALAQDPGCVAIGETGLDWFKEYSPREAQIDSFGWHLDLARELDKAVIIHCRDAHQETARMVKEHPLRRGVMHCYTMGPEELEPYLAAGYCISFSGVVTYPRNESNREAVRQVPLDRILVETDCPFLAPQGFRGKRNEPALVAEVLGKVAELKGLSTEEMARITSENCAQLFDLPPV
jgi:TatD DNase family protein